MRGLLKRYSMCAHFECFDTLSGSTRFFDDSLSMLAAEHDSAGGVCMGQLLTMCVCVSEKHTRPTWHNSHHNVHQRQHQQWPQQQQTRRSYRTDNGTEL
jgi:hypothetical protein